MSSSSSALPDIVKHAVFQAPIHKVWEAVATAEGMSAWFMPNDLKAEEGYEFHILAGPFGKSPCKVTQVEPPYRLSFKWGKDWTLTFELKEADGGQTEFTLTHSGWDQETATEFNESHTVVRERMNGGWTGIVEKLGHHLKGSEAN